MRLEGDAGASGETRRIVLLVRYLHVVDREERIGQVDIEIEVVANRGGNRLTVAGLHRLDRAVRGADCSSGRLIVASNGRIRFVNHGAVPEAVWRLLESLHAEGLPGSTTSAGGQNDNLAREREISFPHAKIGGPPPLEGRTDFSGLFSNRPAVSAVISVGTGRSW